MEKLIQLLIDKHQLSASEAIDAIRMVTDYLKSTNPSVHKLIDTTLENGLDGITGSGDAV
jgi:hypothetical protein